MLKKPSTAAKKSSAGATLRSKRSAVAKKAAASTGRVFPRTKLTASAVSGYTVFDSPVEPKHLTKEQIAEAIASLD